MENTSMSRLGLPWPRFMKVMSVILVVLAVAMATVEVIRMAQHKSFQGDLVLGASLLALMAVLARQGWRGWRGFERQKNSRF
jgi:hypothetical protein